MPHRGTLPHRLAAVWFADIVGYGRLSSRNENAALQLVTVFQRTCRDVIRAHKGRLVKFMGDAALAEFPSTESAVLAACALESKFRARAAALELDLEPPRLHVGLHVGEIATAPDGDIYGEGLNLASRLQDLAGPGQILVSEDVRRQLHQRPEFRFVPLGERVIPDSDIPIPTFSVVTRAGVGGEALVEETSRSWWRALHGELVRRGVYTGGAVYLLGAAVLVAATVFLGGRFDGPSWIERAVALAAVLGLPVAIYLAWTFEVGRAGLRRHDPAFDSSQEVRPGLAFAAVVLVVATVAGMISFVRPTGSVAELPPNRIAVLYFDDISRGGGLGYLVDGLTGSLIQKLSDVRGIEVVSRNGVKQYRDTSVSPDSVARALGAGTLVHGSVAESEGRLQVTVELIDGASGTVLGRDAVERPRGELFALQDDLAERVAMFLRRHLGEEIRLAEMRAETGSQEAWELVQRAEGLREQATPFVEAGNLEAAGRVYDRADSLLARAQLADSLWVQPVVQRGWIAYERLQWYEASDPQGLFLTWLETGLRHAEVALEKDPDDPIALELRGSLRLKRALFAPASDSEEAEAQLLAAEEDLRASVEANPEQAGAWLRLTIPLAARGDLRAAKLAAERAYEADAYLDLPHEIIWRLFAYSYDLNEPVEAERWCREGRQRFPENLEYVQCRIFLMTLPGVTPDPARAWSVLAEFERLAPPQEVMRSRWMETAVAAVIARAGLPDSAIAVAVRARADESVDPARNVLYVEAFVRMLAGREDEAMGLLSAYLNASPGQRGEVANTWWFEDLHDRQDFQALVGGPAAEP